MSIQKIIDKEIQAVSDIAFEYMSGTGMDWTKSETVCAFRESGRHMFLAIVHRVDGTRSRIDQDIGEISPFFSKIAEIRMENVNEINWNALRIFTTNKNETQTEYIADPNFEEDVIERLWEEVDI